MTLFDKIIDEIIEIEGGYVNNSNDSGGATKYGITEEVAIEYGYHGDMSDLPLSLAKQIYCNEYWMPLRLDAIEKISPSIVKELLDTGINQGIGRAGEYLQTSLNALNRRASMYPDLMVDNAIGPKTLDALTRYVYHRTSEGELVLLRCLNCLQGAFYIELASNREKDEEFLYGWILNRVVI